jgi:hypothetical protein
MSSCSRCSILGAAERFYAGVLGLPIALRSENRVWVTAGTQTRIGLWAPQVGIADGRGGVHVHYALHIDEADYGRRRRAIARARATSRTKRTSANPAARRT